MISNFRECLSFTLNSIASCVKVLRRLCGKFPSIQDCNQCKCLILVRQPQNLDLAPNQCIAMRTARIQFLNWDFHKCKYKCSQIQIQMFTNTNINVHKYKYKCSQIQIQMFRVAKCQNFKSGGDLVEGGSAMYLKRKMVQLL